VLLCCCVVVLLCCCAVVLLCYCVVVLLCWCVGVLVYCCVVVLFVFKRLVVFCIYDIMPQQSYHHQQYDKIRISYSFKDPPKKASMPVKSYSTSPKKGVEEKKMGHKIINVTYPDNTPFGWAFDNFYDAKDFIKHLYNRDGKVTIYLVAYNSSLFPI
jgi:hypothetical protein